MAVEAPPVHLRGYFSGLLLLFLSIGDLSAVTVSLPFVLGEALQDFFAQIIGTPQLWTAALVAAGVPVLIFLPVLIWAHESPRHLFFSCADRT